MADFWRDKTALVTGGSSGFGLALAQALARHGARVVIAARGAEALERAADELRRLGAKALAVPTDVTRQEQVERLVERTISEFGGLDLLINNAGRSARGRVLETTPEEFQAAWDLNFLSVVRVTRAAAPHLLKSRGHLVNIGSLAGKSAAAWLGAYPPAKFAVSAYTQQLRLEMSADGLHVLLVCPGPIAGGGEGRYSKEVMDRLPESARRPGGGVAVRAIDPAWLAERTLWACQRREIELVVPRKARILFVASQVSARLGDWLVRKTTGGGS